MTLWDCKKLQHVFQIHLLLLFDFNKQKKFGCACIVIPTGARLVEQPPKLAEHIQHPAALQLLEKEKLQEGDFGRCGISAGPRV